VLVDPNQLAEVLSRLTVAACDAILATGDDGGRIDVRTERVHNPVGLPAGEYVRLVIAHDGRGLDAAALAKVFEPYGSVADLGDGTDLGLSTVAGILRQNRGGIACESAPEVGTTFTLDWPLRTADSVLVPRSPLAGRGELVVLVDDDDGVRQFAAAALRERGYEVRAFADGAAALRLLAEPLTAGDPFAAREPAPAILLTDVVMPGIDGKELAARIRQLRPALPVLYISGYSDDILSHDGLLDDNIALLEKPFSGDDLAVAVRAVLDSASSR
jgi:CheY-like chemotaxis protein